MSLLSPTPRERMVDAQGRPYFLWDSDMTLTRFREVLRDPDDDVRAYYVGKLMRQAKPDDAFTFVSLEEIRDLWPKIERNLGRTREFWTWWMEQWTGSSSALVESVVAPVMRAVATKSRDDDAVHEILVNKLCALISPTELRDLRDVRELVARGGDLARGLREAPRKDGGFSALTLGWQLKAFPIATMAATEDLPSADVKALESCRDELVKHLGELTRPGDAH
jgi:hypothetical protein